MLEFFLWFWLLDRRYLCDFRPALKYFSFLFLLPIASHSLTICFNIYCLFPFNKFMNPAYLVAAFETILEIISTICLTILMSNLYGLSKRQPKKQKNNFVLMFERVKSSKEENFIYYAWYLFYVLHRNMFHEVFDWVEQFIIFIAYLNIFFFIPIVLVLFLATVIKVGFTLTAMICPSFVLSLSDSCCKRNKKLNRTIDFSDVETLEPEYI